MDALGKNSYGFEKKCLSPIGTARVDQNIDYRKKHIVVSKTYNRQYGKLNQRRLLEEKLSIFRDTLPDQWRTDEVKYWAKQLCREPESFNRIVQTVRNKCLIVPSLDRSIKSHVVQAALENNPDCLLIALDNLTPSYLLSNLLGTIRTNEKKSYHNEIATLQQKITQLEKLTRDKDEALEQTKGKLVRNTDPTAAVEKNIKLADDFAERIIPVVDDLRNKGHSTYRGIADELNNLGWKTRGGKDWSPTAVMRIDRRKEMFEEQEIASNIEEDCFAI